MSQVWMPNFAYMKFLRKKDGNHVQFILRFQAVRLKSNVDTETDSICLQVQTQIIYDWIELAHAFLGSCYWGFAFFLTL